MSEGIHERYDERMSAEAEKAFDNLPEEREEEVKAARAQLMNWLVSMHHAVSNRYGFADELMVNTACTALEHGIAKRLEDLKGKKHDAERKLLIAFGKAFQGLPDGDQMGLMQYVLGTVFSRCATDTKLVSRQSDSHPWEVTGFSVDGLTKVALAKVGTNVGQPIGFDDGERYIGTEGSKTLWLREWGMALVTPWAPPFEIERIEIEAQDVSDDLQVSDKERIKISEVIEMFDYDIAEHGKLKPTQKKERQELENKMREGIKLACLRLPRLDKKLDEITDEHPDIGANFENVDALQLLVSCREFLQMKLDDDSNRRKIEATVMHVGSYKEEQYLLIQNALESLAVPIPEEGKEPEGETLQRALDEAAIVLPFIRGHLDDLKEANEDVNVLEAAESTMIVLQKKLDELVDATPPDKEESEDEEGEEAP